MTINSGVILVAFLAATTIPAAFAQGPGADTYKSKCAMCHGADGLASGPAGKSMKIAAFNSPEASKMSEAAMITETKNGKAPKMPAFASKLTDEQIKEVVAYVHTLQK